MIPPVTLQGQVVRIEPLGLQHAEALHAISDEDLLKYQIVLWGGTLNEFRDCLTRVIERPGLAFAVIDLESGKPIGSTTYMDPRLEHRALEIGSTWIARPFQGTKVNPEMKFLMLRHAFETLGCVRVQLKADARNAHSIRAMEKLGCVKEGVWRKHMVLRDGFIRDTVMYSIIEDEWPAVRDRLIARLGYLP